jgi:predicted site-specific integrase-resolvase
MRKIYTVNQLARLAGISVRTLHHYDEMGLLKPAFTGENRYHGHEGLGAAAELAASTTRGRRGMAHRLIASVFLEKTRRPR